LLPLTRAIGVLTVLPMAWHFFEKAWRSRRAEPLAACGSTAVLRAQLRSRFLSALEAQPLWLLAAPMLGWVVYLALMWGWMGHPFEGFTAQKFWGARSIGNLWNVPKFVTSFFTVTEWHEYGSSVLERCAFALLVYCLPAIWRLRRGAFAWTCGLAVVPLMSGPFISFTRYLSCAFPVFIALGVFLGRREWRGARYALLGLFLVLPPAPPLALCQFPVGGF
jgi:hypothetical protein